MMVQFCKAVGTNRIHRFCVQQLTIAHRRVAKAAEAGGFACIVQVGMNDSALCLTAVHLAAQRRVHGKACSDVTRKETDEPVLQCHLGFAGRNNYLRNPEGKSVGKAC